MNGTIYRMEFYVKSPLIQLSHSSCVQLCTSAPPHNSIESIVYGRANTHLHVEIKFDSIHLTLAPLKTQYFYSMCNVHVIDMN